MATPKWLQTAATVLGHVSTIDWLFRIVGGFLSASWVLSMMPGGWHPPQYWAVGGLAFSGGLLIVSLCSIAVQNTWKGKHPIAFRLEPHGGQEATLTLFVDAGVETFRPTAQLFDPTGTSLLPPYDLRWRLAPGQFSSDTTKTISEGEFSVLGICLGGR